eukprot:1701516-Pyramimonas_sp.AAC.1
MPMDMLPLAKEALLQTASAEMSFASPRKALGDVTNNGLEVRSSQNLVVRCSPKYCPHVFFSRCTTASQLRGRDKRGRQYFRTHWTRCGLLTIMNAALPGGKDACWEDAQGQRLGCGGKDLTCIRRRLVLNRWITQHLGSPDPPASDPWPYP